MSDEEEVLSVLPRKRRRVCPKIPYVFGDTIVYGCERCMALRDMRWLTWMWAGEKLGLPKEIAELIGERLEKPWVEWKTWWPLDVATVTIPLSQLSLLRRFCCDKYDFDELFTHPLHTRRTCYCSRETWVWLTEVCLGGPTTGSLLAFCARECNTVTIVRNK
jgi:hypothetical protein